MPQTPTSSKIVLIVDDNLTIRQKISAKFLSQGFAPCIEASDGQEAIRLAGICNPDLVILDVSMPIMNGIEAASQLRRVAPDAAIILLTLSNDQIKKADLDRLGMSAAFLKRDGLDKLLLMAREMLGP